MALKKKKKESVPPISPKLPSLEINTPQPAFPQGFNSEVKMPSLNSITLNEPVEVKQPEVKQTFPSALREVNHGKEEGDEPFFVRIDKFNDSKQNFEKISSKVKELEHILNVLEQVKEKEEKELEMWKSQTNEIKDFLIQIDKDLFSKL